jgi:hypothetical protein
MKWRVGRSVPLNVYDAKGNPICQCHTSESATFLVNCVNHRILDSLISNGALFGAETYFPDEKPDWACPGYGHRGHNCTTCTGCCDARKLPLHVEPATTRSKDRSAVRPNEK